MSGVIRGKYNYPIRDEGAFLEFKKEFIEKCWRMAAQPLEEGNELVPLRKTDFNFLPSPTYTVGDLDRPSSLQSYGPSIASCTPSIYPFREKNPILSQLKFADGFQIRLIKRLTTLAPRKADVWIVSIQDQTAVLKIFQDHNLESPVWLADHECMDSDFCPEEEEAHREAWAYQTLINLQGSNIPYSYGFFDVSYDARSEHY